MNEVLVRISGEILTEILTVGEKRFRVIEGLPPGARLINMSWDGVYGDELVLRYSHPTFPKRDEGCIAPDLPLVTGIIPHHPAEPALPSILDSKSEADKTSPTPAPSMCFDEALEKAKIAVQVLSPNVTQSWDNNEIAQTARNYLKNFLGG